MSEQMRVNIIWRNIPLMSGLFLQEIDSTSAFLASDNPMPVGTSFVILPLAQRDMSLVGTVIQVSEACRNRKGEESAQSGMVLQLEPADQSLLDQMQELFSKLPEAILEDEVPSPESEDEQTVSDPLEISVAAQAAEIETPEVVTDPAHAAEIETPEVVTDPAHAEIVTPEVEEDTSSDSPAFAPDPATKNQLSAVKEENTGVPSSVEIDESYLAGASPSLPLSTEDQVPAAPDEQSPNVIIDLEALYDSSGDQAAPQAEEKDEENKTVGEENGEAEETFDAAGEIEEETEEDENSEDGEDADKKKKKKTRSRRRKKKK